MTECFVHLDRLLALPCLIDAIGIESIEISPDTVVLSADVTETGTVQLLGHSGRALLEISPISDAGRAVAAAKPPPPGGGPNPPRISVVAEHLPWRVAAEISGALFGESRRLVERSSDILQSLTRADHQSQGAAALLETLTRLIDRPVAFKDPAHELLAWAGDVEEMDPVRQATIHDGKVSLDIQAYLDQAGVLHRISVGSEAFQVDGAPQFGMSPRVLCPVRGAEVLYGYLSIAEGNRPLDPLDYLAVETGAALISLHVARRRAIQERTRTHRAMIAYDLIFGPAGDDPITRKSHAEQAGLDLEADHYLAVVIAHQREKGTARDAREELSMLSTVDDLLDRQATSSAVALQVEGAFTLLIGDDEHGAHALLQRVVAELRAYHRITNVAVGLGGPCSDPRKWRSAWMQARLAARMADSDKTVIHYRHLGALRLLDDIPPETVEEQLELVLGTDQKFRNMFQETFGALVETGFNKAEAARRLYVHVNTMRYRLERIHKISGLDPDDPEGRFTLECMLRLLVLRGTGPIPRTAQGHSASSIRTAAPPKQQPA